MKRCLAPEAWIARLADFPTMVNLMGLLSFERLAGSEPSEPPWHPDERARIEINNDDERMTDFRTDRCSIFRTSNMTTMGLSEFDVPDLRLRDHQQ
jgi:hypothetical protein